MRGTRDGRGSGALLSVGWLWQADRGVEGGAGAVFPGLDPALAFFLGGVLVIFILVCYEAWVWKKNNK